MVQILTCLVQINLSIVFFRITIRQRATYHSLRHVTKPNILRRFLVFVFLCFCSMSISSQIKNIFNFTIILIIIIIIIHYY